MKKVQKEIDDLTIKKEEIKSEKEAIKKNKKKEYVRCGGSCEVECECSDDTDEDSEDEDFDDDNSDGDDICLKRQLSKKLTLDDKKKRNDFYLR